MKERWLYFLLIPIPFIWALLSFGGYLDMAKSGGMDLRFRMRGEIDSPAKVIYADLDARAMNMDQVGERPWDRQFFAEAGFLLLEYGGARVVGYDFVFSPKSMSRLVPERNIVESNQNIAALISRHPDRIVLAGDYTGVFLPYMDMPSIPPLKYRGYRHPRLNAYPETPSFPILNVIDGRRIGRVGMISVDESVNPDPVPRWAPLFFEYEGPVHYRNIMTGKQFVYRVQGLETELVENVEEDLFELKFRGNTVETFPRNTAKRFHHFALEMFLAAHGLGEDAVKVHKNRLEIFNGEGTRLKRIPLTREQLIEINYFSPWISEKNPRVSLADLFYNEHLLFSEDPEEQAQGEAFFSQFEDALVLIGPVDPLLQDLSTTPMDPREVPRVGVHGNLLKTIYADRFIKRLAPVWEFGLLFALTLMAVCAGLYSGRYSVASKVAAGLILAAYAGAAFYGFARYDLVIPMVGPLGSATTTLFFGIVGKLILEEHQKGRIKGMFGTYVSPELVESMVESGQEPRLGGYEESITAFFSDIQSFSAFSEKLPPTQLVALMNEYLSAMTDIIQEEKGTLDKYIGDAIVAMYGAPVQLPDHAARACRSAVRVQHEQARLREKWKAEGDKWPEIVHQMQTRVGLNSGLATVGNMGSSKRFNYTMMGDVVNLAARSESGAKSYGVYTMVTEETRRLCEEAESSLCFRFLDKIVVKGRTQPVSMYELVDFQANVSAEERRTVDLFHEAVEHYLMQRWDKALELFEEASRCERFRPENASWVETNPSLLMAERCRSMKASPPGADWDGVYRMTTK